MRGATSSRAISMDSSRAPRCAGPGGETKVAGALQDYQDNTKKLQSLFNADYAASAEATTVLKQSTSIDRFMQTSSSAMKGRSEWDRQVVNLKRLAEVVRHHVSSGGWGRGPPDERQGDGRRGRVSRHGGGTLQGRHRQRQARSRNPTRRPPRRTSRRWSSKPIPSSHASTTASRPPVKCGNWSNRPPRSRPLSTRTRSPP